LTRRRKEILLQAALAAVLAFLGWILYSNTVANLETRRIASGFAFLWREAGFEIGETTFFAFSAADSYARALVVGIANTLRVAVVGIVLATLLGTLVGLARLSPNWLLARIAGAYVEALRNVPLLVQLFFWYVVISDNLPAPAEALHPLPGVFLSNRGVFFPLPGDMPHLEGFNFTGGGSLTPEFAALLMGLVTYTAAFIAEIVRAGIVSVPRGQVDAALSLGLTRRQAMRRVTIPLALRLIVPPITSQYLNLAKNSSLAVAIGYPDLVSIANTTMNQTGQSIEGIAIIMATFLTISLSIAAFMNWYNRRVALQGLVA
jgi:general L-amino acid transport system permease protein